MANVPATSQGFQVPAYLQNLFKGVSNRDLTDNVAAPISVVSMRGKIWRLNDQGVETIVTDANRNPSSVMECVIIRTNPTLSRLYYEGKYKEGDDNPPTCWSLDNQEPDRSVARKQSPACPTCPHNAWGTRQSENGSKGKACSEVRRLAIVPLYMLNEANLTPYLFRVPPGSLRTLKAFGDGLESLGVAYPMIITKIGFSVDANFELTFEAVDFLPEALAVKVMELGQSDRVRELLNLSENATRVPGQTPEPAQAQTAQAPQPAPAPAPQVQTAQAPQPAPAPATAAATAPKPKPKPKPAPAATKPAPAAGGSPLGNLMKGLGVPGVASAAAAPQVQTNGSQTINGQAEEVEGETQEDEGSQEGEEQQEEQQTQAPDGLRGLVSRVLGK